MQIVSKNVCLQLLPNVTEEINVDELESVKVGRTMWELKKISETSVKTCRVYL